MDYKKIRQYWEKYKAVLIFAILLAIAAGLFTWQKGERYNASLALIISRAGTQPAYDYKYDNYYALKATDEFGETVAAWFKTPEIAKTVYQRAGFDSSQTTLVSLARRFNAAKTSPNLVEVRYSTKSEAEAKKVSQAIGAVILEKVNLLNNSSAQGISFAVLAGEPVIVKNTYAIFWSALAGFLVGLVVGFFIKVAREYFR